jgi:hypothetical protein
MIVGFASVAGPKFRPSMVSSVPAAVASVPPATVTPVTTGAAYATGARCQWSPSRAAATRAPRAVPPLMVVPFTFTERTRLLPPPAVDTQTIAVELTAEQFRAETARVQRTGSAGAVRARVSIGACDCAAAGGRGSPRAADATFRAGWAVGHGHRRNEIRSLRLK